MIDFAAFISSPLFGLVLVVAKGSIVFGLGFLLTHALRHRSAAVRHFIWVATLLGALAIPVLTPLLPRLEWGVMAPSRPATGLSAVTSPEVIPGIETKRTTLSPPATIEKTSTAGRPFSFPRLWLAGALLVAAWCAMGHLALLRIVGRARPVTDSAWLGLLDETAGVSGVSRPVRLMVAAGIDSPMTWGYRRPIVLLPETAMDWSGDRRRAVLLHELAHVSRLDFVCQILAALACALYWFHPGAWAAARRLRHESERACDDRALASGTPPADYASHLLCLALQSKGRHWPDAMAVGLTRPSTLEARVRAVLDERLTRRALSPRVRIAGAIILGAFVLLLSALTPVRAALNSAVLEGPPVDRSAKFNGEMEERTPYEAAEAPTAPEETAPVADATPVVAEASQMVSRTLDARPGEELELRLQAGGNVDIRGWDEPSVQVRARVGGPDADRIKVDVDRTDKGVKVHAYFAERSRAQTSSNDFQIRVPRRFDLRLESSGGGLHLSDVEGTFTGNTGGGEIVLEHVKGHASLNTGGSDIRVTDSHLSGAVSTGGGTVDLIRVKGGLVGSSGSGRVRYFDSKGAAELDKLGQELNELGENMEELRDNLVTVNAEELTDRAEELALNAKELAENSKELTQRSKELTEHSAELAARAVEMSKSGGGITLTDIPRGATLSTGGGDVEIGRTAGPVVVSTGGGDMEIGPVYGSLDASTGAGNIRVEVAATDEDIQVSSGSGRVVLELPASFNGRIDLESAYTKRFGRATRIDSDWTLEREFTAEWDGSGGQAPRRYVRGHAILGDGRGRVRVRTVNGDIVLHRVK